MYTKVYKEFLGADVSSERSEVDDNRFAHLINMWRDYRTQDGVAIETAVGFDKVSDGEGKVYGLHYLPAKGDYSAKIIVHRGNKLYALEGAKETRVPITGFGATDLPANDHPSYSVCYYGALYIVDGKNYYRIENGAEAHATLAEWQTAYVPITYSNGIAYEQRNLLTNKVREVYVADGNTAKFFIHDPVSKVQILLDGVEVKPFAYEPFPGDAQLGTRYKDADGNDIQMTPKTGVTSFYEDGETVLVGTRVQSYEDGTTDENAVLYAHYRAASSADDEYFLLKLNDPVAAMPFSSDKGTPIIDAITFAQTPSKLTTVEFKSDALPNRFATVGNLKDALVGNPDMNGEKNAWSAINGCTLITEFDGRIFLSGNPKLPNTIFYTQRDIVTGLNSPFYIGAYNYLNDGTDGTPITGMISTATTLIVLKGDSPQGSTLYYHQGVNNDSEDKVLADLQPRLYPRTSGVAGEGCTGVAVNFLDDACFVSRKGLEAVGREAVNLERTLTHRSVYVDSFLQSEDLTNMAYAEWEGYLCLIAPSGRMYLADGRKRTSHKHYGYQYEWFIWDDIGVYEKQTDRYFYVNDGVGGTVKYNGITYGIGEREGYTDGEVVNIDGGSYVLEDGYAFPVDTDGEKHGGKFSPATCLLSVGGRLYFGCANGAVCVFNTDMVEGAIPAEKYTRNGRRYMAQISTKSDNCGAPYAEKTTERGTVVIKAKAFPSAKVRVMVRTDRDIWRQCDEVYLGVTDFGNMDFGTFKFGNVDETIAPVRENKRRWVEKQIGLEAECYKSPVGIINITYGYRITGKVRRR